MGPRACNICAESLTEAALQCIEELPCTAGEDELDECVNKNPPGGSSESDGPTETGGTSAGDSAIPARAT